MTTETYLDEQELRRILKLDSPRKRSTWFRLRPLFAPALLRLPTGSARGHRLYDAAKVRELIEARREVPSGLSRSRTLRAVR